MGGNSKMILLPLWNFPEILSVFIGIEGAMKIWFLFLLLVGLILCALFAAATLYISGQENPT